MIQPFSVNRLRGLQSLGQSVWLDELHRGMLVGKRLRHLIDEDGISGVTSNPTIFAKAFAEDTAYREAISQLRAVGLANRDLYDRLCIDDVRLAADQLRRTYEHSDRCDGYVSIEVSPHLAHDAEGTLDEAQRLRQRIDRPNVMIKVAATDEGVQAIPRLIALGINVNATLIFGTRRCRQVADAYMVGLEQRVSSGQALDTVASVASLFVSRIDTLADKLLTDISSTSKATSAQRLLGKVALAVARYAYQEYKKSIASSRWQALAARHARPQRLLWASTGTKNPQYADVKYIDALIGQDTVTTVPQKTLDAFRDHGAPAPNLERDLLDVADTLAVLPSLAIDLEAIERQLEREGLTAFSDSLDAALNQLQR